MDPTKRWKKQREHAYTQLKLKLDSKPANFFDEKVLSMTHFKEMENRENLFGY